MVPTGTDWTAETLRGLATRTDGLKRAWDAARPFRWISANDFLPTRFTEELLAEFPDPATEGWMDATYFHQRRKLTRTRDFPPAITQFFALTAHASFLDWVTSLTGIRNLRHDPDLVGGGLHQSLPGAFLDVHVDYNRHPRTKLHRRLNLLLYLNRDWKAEWEGCLELWDITANHQLAQIAPVFNRAVIFETNEHSFHGHPRPLHCPDGESRKSLAVYYYTDERDDGVSAEEHNTIYRQTTGAAGYLKTTRSGLHAVVERLRQGRGLITVDDFARKLIRRLRGKPPENK